MARSLIEIEADLEALRAEVQQLKRSGQAREHPVRQLAGCFTGDEEWKAIQETIEESRRQPDPDLASS